MRSYQSLYTLGEITTKRLVELVSVIVLTDLWLGRPGTTERISVIAAGLAASSSRRPSGHDDRRRNAATIPAALCKLLWPNRTNKCSKRGAVSTSNILRTFQGSLIFFKDESVIML